VNVLIGLGNIYKVVFIWGGMKRVIVLFVCVLFIGFVGAGIPGDCDLSEGMVAYWRMNGDLNDSFGGHDAGGWDGAEVYSGYGVDGLAAMFDGSKSVTISGVNDLDFQFAFSVEFLVNSVSSVNSTLFKKGNYEISWVNGGVSQGSVVASVGGVDVSSSASLVDGVNYHVVLVWEPASTNLTLYINGVNRDQASLLAPVSVVDNLIIGDGFNGWIDEVAVYDSSFVQSTVNYHYSLLNIGKDYCDSSGVNGSSTTKADFNIEGCALPDGTGLSKSTCSVDGEFYCNDDDEWLRTRDVGGCSLSGEPCCPSGFYCNATSLACVQSTDKCSDQSESTCENVGGCVWLDSEGLCVFSGDYSCSVYKSQTLCEDDVWNLAREGVGTEVCDLYMVVDGVGYDTHGSCDCEWNSGECRLGYDIYPDVYGASPDWFKCLKAFDIGECVDGVQDFSWSINSTEATGVFDITSPSWNVTLYEKVAEAAGCSVGSSVRNCGEPVVRLPGFSFFAFFASVFVIGLVYVKLGSFK